MTSAPLRPRTSVPYADKWVKQPGLRQSFLARYTGRPPPHRPAYDGQRGGIRPAFVSTQPDIPVHRPTAQLTASRYLRAAWASLASGVHRPTIRITPTPGEIRAGRPARKRPNPCRNHYAAGPASSLYASYGPCSSVPASGCHHRPVPDDPTGLTEQALNLLLLAVSPSGTRKTRTKSHALRSQAVAPTTWQLRLARTTPRCPSSIIRQLPVKFQSPTV